MGEVNNLKQEMIFIVASIRSEYALKDKNNGSFGHVLTSTITCASMDTGESEFSHFCKSLFSKTAWNRHSKPNLCVLQIVLVAIPLFN